MPVTAKSRGQNGQVACGPELTSRDGEADLEQDTEPVSGEVAKPQGAIGVKD